METFDANDPGLTDKLRGAVEGAYDLAYIWMRGRLLRDEIGITEDEYLHDENLVSSKRRKADKWLKQLQPPVDIIVAGFSGEHPILILGETGKVDEIPDTAIIGSGHPVALHWLNFRGQKPHMSLTRSFYHIKEATFFASQNPSVGEKAHVALLAPGFREILTRQPEKSGNLTQDWWEQIGPKDTAVLDDDICRKQFEDYWGIELPPKTV
jgi:hypothetical protein